MIELKNPILSGFYPDPSICRVGRDYYLVNSTFCYFPAVPIFHSYDLVHWEQIGNVLDRNSQVDLSDCEHSGGIFAPTIRWHDGTFYMITTNMTHGGTFIVTAQDPKGPWSEPHFITGAGSMDPSLFFDSDGKAYCIATRPNSDGVRYFGDWEIWICEIDLQTMKLMGKDTIVWRGALRDAVWPEGPHLYKHGEYYYLMSAEGGTDFLHAVVIARSSSITGTYEGNPANPILTHRHLGRNNTIVNVGHGDLVDTPDGKWFMVILGSRPCEGYTNMGRETFLTPIEWQGDWPVANPGHGKVEETQAINMDDHPLLPQPHCDHFEGPKLNKQWVFLRNPTDNLYSLSERKEHLRLYLKPQTLSDLDNPAFLGVRQRHQNYLVETKMEFTPRLDGETSGLAVIQSNHYYVRFEKALQNGELVVRIVQTIQDEERIIAQKPCSGDVLYLKIVEQRRMIRFYYGESSDTSQLLYDNMDASMLSTEIAGGFVGCCIGLFATSSGKKSDHYSDFQWFEYGPVDN